jgi:hypothetical protein
MNTDTRQQTKTALQASSTRPLVDAAREARLKESLKGHNDLALFCFFNKIKKLPIIRYHTRGSQNLTQYVSQISRAQIERISQIVKSSKIKFSKKVRTFTGRWLIARSLNLRLRIFDRSKQILSGIEN